MIQVLLLQAPLSKQMEGGISLLGYLGLFFSVTYLLVSLGIFAVHMQKWFYRLVLICHFVISTLCSEVATYLRAQISLSTPARMSTLNPSPSLLHVSASPRPASRPSSSSSLPPAVQTWAARLSTASAPPAPPTMEATERITGPISTLRLAWVDPRPLGPKRGRAPRSSACAWTPGWHKAVRSLTASQSHAGLGRGKGRERSDSREGHYCYYSIVII